MINRRGYIKVVAIIAGVVALVFCGFILIPKKSIVVRGDLHVHTKYSHDGFYTMEQTAEYSKQSGYDFIAVTDHNTANQNKDKYKDDKLIIIPGMELTPQRGIGHANVIGIPNPKEKIDIITKEEMTEYFSEMRGKGAKMQINHPFDPTWPWNMGFDVSYSWIELWNGVFNEADEKAIDWWQEQLKSGKKIIATGGSDTHNQQYNRSPFNNVYAKSKDSKDILTAIDKGNLYISLSAKGPDIELRTGKSIMGDTVEFKQGSKINLSISGLTKEDKIIVISDKGREFEEVATDSRFKKEWNMENRIFYRVEVRRANSMLSFSNPIYINQSK